MTSTEKRKHNRFEIHQAITLKFGEERYIDCKGLNISEGGLLVLTEKPLEIYDRLFVMFSIPNDIMINIEAIVMRIEKHGKKHHVGLEIADIKPEDKRKLKKYLASL